MSSPIGGFFPIPLAMMIPFMATQSLIMGDAFGRSFQYGKRKISAMSNEEFNDLTTEKIAQTIFAEYKNIIPSLNQSLVDSQELQKKVVDELLSLPSNFLADVWDNIANPNKKDTSFIPNSNNPSDSRTWSPGWSPSSDQDFNPPSGAPQPAQEPQQPSGPTSRRDPTPTVITRQQLIEKNVLAEYHRLIGLKKQINAWSVTAATKTRNATNISAFQKQITNGNKWILAQQNLYKQLYGKWIILV